VGTLRLDNVVPAGAVAVTILTPGSGDVVAAGAVTIMVLTPEEGVGLPRLDSTPMLPLWDGIDVALSVLMSLM
jgi:hypothetical protein